MGSYSQQRAGHGTAGVSIASGSVFGKWTVVGRDVPLHKKADLLGNRHLRWLCRCECGIERRIDSGNLRSGATKSCGRCRWNIRVPAGSKRCDQCGNIFRLSAFKDKQTRESCKRCLSCRAKLSNNSAKVQRKLKAENPARYRAYRFLHRSRRFVARDITVDWLESRFRAAEKCVCCGRTMRLVVLPAMGKDDTYPTVDRRDNSKDYTKDNIAIVCWRCNNRKSDMTVQDVRTLLAYMTAGD